MRYYPNKDCPWDYEEVNRMQPEDWMLDLLKLNPSYCSWGPHEDYMWNDKEHSWASRLLYDSWDDFNIALDDLNEVVNFYFEIGRESEKCYLCNGSGIHPDAQWVSESFYEHCSPFISRPPDYSLVPDYLKNLFPDDPSPKALDYGSFPSDEILDRYHPDFREFCEKMRDGRGYWGDDDLDALDLESLEEAGRPYDPNDKFGMDAINRSIVSRSRCERWGIPHECPECDGHGYIYQDEAAHVGLVLWLLHPRKGASRGVHIKRVEQAQLPEVYQFLREARERNANRFGRIPDDVDKA
tara:strand:- start:31137 stop:32027 length:891 start_codon:yes stop_codon:yes gene_type:complete